MITHSISASLAIITLVLGSTAVLANSQSPSLLQEYAQANPNNRRETKRKDFLEQLNLSEQQQQQISAIRQKYESDLEQTRKKFRTNLQELRQLMAGDASKQTIRSKHQQVSELRQELETLRFESMLEIRDVLTPAQRQELTQLMQQRRGRVQDRTNERPATQPNDGI